MLYMITPSICSKISPVRIVQFSNLHGSDGKTYAFSELSNGRPVIFFLLRKDDGLLGISYIEELRSQLENAAQVIGLTDGPTLFRSFIKSYHPKFLVLDQMYPVALKEVSDDHTICGLEMCLVTKQGKIVKNWFGFNRE